MEAGRIRSLRFGAAAEGKGQAEQGTGFTLRRVSVFLERSALMYRFFGFT